MKTFVDCLLPEQWRKVIEHLTIMQDTCSLAMVNKRFYKLVEMDFKQLCYDHVVYRLKGETWAWAFSNFFNRAYNVMCGPKGLYMFNGVCCPFTGKMAMRVRDHSSRILLTNIDFGRNEFTILDFTAYTKFIGTLCIINQGSELLLRLSSSVLIYDLNAMKVTYHITFTKPARTEYQAEYLSVQAGSIVDYYTKKRFTIDARSPEFFMHYVNRFDKCKYVVVRTTNDEVIVIDSETDERHNVCKWRHDTHVYIINVNNCVVLLGLRGCDIGCRIYCLKRKTFVLDLTNDKWCLFNSNTLYNCNTSSFLVYDKHIRNWREVRPDTWLGLERRCDCSITDNFVPFTSYKVMKSFRNNAVTLVFLNFKKGNVRVKSFHPELAYKSTNGCCMPKELDYDHPIAHLMQLQYPTPNEKSKEFSDWFTKLHINRTSVPLIDAKTGAIKEELYT
ncbi:unnamed protein product [Bursaphelenchus okinawaensis]|uniref:F-box domain-containing protein n=1 Tax=Bursaphelenchus okinawaensis TaxID=465554 RepID=A0A811LRQ9_9BILA|nr:unnamed protein product [Bursaphelenchus okinawaensis]CAG9126909.1 unnamed protein product [Bursaphelenchus okinawaensis]